MAVNPLGAVPIFDGGVPRTMTVLASVGVTGGQLVYFSGANGNISSGANSYVSADISIIGEASGNTFNGIVLTPGNTASGTSNYVTVALDGCYILNANNTVVGGQPVMTDGTDEVQDVGSIGGTALRLGIKIGRALSNAASGTSNYALIQLTP